MRASENWASGRTALISGHKRPTGRRRQPAAAKAPTAPRRAFAKSVNCYMLKNYCRIAWRNLRRNSFYSVLNITGLSIGVACGLVLFLFIQYHLAFNAYHQKATQLYRVVTDLHLADGSVQN